MKGVKRKLPENLPDLDDIDYEELSGEELGLLYLIAIQREDESAKSKIVDEILDSL